MDSFQDLKETETIQEDHSEDQGTDTTTFRVVVENMVIIFCRTDSRTHILTGLRGNFLENPSYPPPETELGQVSAVCLLWHLLVLSVAQAPS